jgi:hypothetical protein
MTVYELALRHMQANGMAEPDAVAALEYFGGAEGRNIPWGDVVPFIPRRWLERIDAAAVGWIHSHRLAVGGEELNGDATPEAWNGLPTRSP